jgi:DNA polymerase-3 subunit delta'
LKGGQESLHPKYSVAQESHDNVLWGVVGQKATVRFLERALIQNQLAHAYILSGPPQVGKRTIALALARAVNCEGAISPCGECTPCQRIAAGRHADVVVLEVQEQDGDKIIKLGAIRDLQHQIALKPYEGRCRVCIIRNAEFLSMEAAGALLKTLEEPPAQTLLLLTSAAPGHIQETVLSRCQTLEIRPMSIAEIASILETRWKRAPEEAQRLARFSRGCIGWAIRALDEETMLESRSQHLERLARLPTSSLEERFSYAAELAALMPQQHTTLREIMDLWGLWWQDLLALQVSEANLDVVQEAMEAAMHATRELSLSQIGQAIRNLRRTQELLELNVNPRLALENLMLTLPNLKTPTNRPL